MIEGLKPPAEFNNRDELAVCPQPDCGQANVTPVDQDYFGRNHIWMLCHCPDCNWLGHGIYSHNQVMDFHEELGEAKTDIMRDVLKLQEADLADMEDQIRILALACELDLVYPSDIAGQTLL